MGETFYIVQQAFSDHEGARSEFPTFEEAKEFVETLRKLIRDDTDHGVKYYIYKVNKVSTFIF